jgi:hypothetical protein
MTTPEKFRRRQRIEGTIVIALAIASIAYGVVDSREEQARDACMVKSFEQANDVQNLRASLAEQTSEVQEAIDNNQNRVIQTVSSANNRKEVARAFAEFNAEVERLDDERAELLRERKNTDIPPFPTGKCE